MRPKKILLIDDDIDVHLLLKYQMARQGFLCEAVFTIEEAVQRLAVDEYDLILLDLCFAPKNGDGETFLAHINHLQRRGHILPPIVVTSGLNDREVMDYIMDLGAVGYVTKPFKTETLVEMVNQYAL